MVDTTGDLQARVEQLEARLRQLEKREAEEGMGPLRTLLRELMPPEARAHLRSARREQLLAVRSVLDRMIAKTERQETTERRERIAVD